MFQEFVNRSGFDAAGLNRLERFGARFIVTLGRRFPSLFFVFVLGGEARSTTCSAGSCTAGEPSTHCWNVSCGFT
jgi:hypothetical protein